MKKKSLLTIGIGLGASLVLAFGIWMTQANKSMALEEIKLDDGKTNTSSSGNVYTDGGFCSTSRVNQEIMGQIFKAGSYVPFTFYKGTPPIFCKQHGGRITDYANTELKIGPFDLGQIIWPRQGQQIKLEGDPGVSSASTESLCKYDNVVRKTAGKDGDWALAYVMSQFKKNTDKTNGEVQNAFWAILGQGGERNDLAKEADAFQDYKKKLKEAGGFKGSYKIDLSNTSYNETKDEIIVGPVSFKYVRGFAKIGNRAKVDFGGIKTMKLYDQDGKEIDQSIWKITYDAEHKDSKKARPDGDEDYGQQGSEFFQYPYSEEAFNIVLNGTKCKEKKIKKISKLYVELYDKDFVVDYQDLNGEYREVTWNVDSDSYTCNNAQRYTDAWGNEIVNPCEHGYTTAHQVQTNYRVTANVKQLSPQKLVCVIKVDDSTNTGGVDIPTVLKSPPRVKIPAIPSIINTSYNWPSWPDYPDYPDEPDNNIEVTLRLAGVVWEDTQTGKESNYDGVIGTQNDGTQEKGIKNVKVTLYKHGTTELAEAKENPVYTNDGGEYYFTRIPMGKYDVGFEYDGMTYTTTKVLASGSAEDYKNNPNDTKYVKDSKTEETAEARQNFNNKFYEISGDSSNTSDNGTSHGTARDASGNKTADLEYKTENGVSTLVTTDENGYVKSEFAMTANTATMGMAYPFTDRYTDKTENKTIDNEVYETTYKYMGYINLGLKRRPQADIAVSKDVDTATLTINKKEMTYRYNARAGLDGFDINVKNSPSYSNIAYNREIYKSDYNYRIDDYKNNNLNVAGSTLKGIQSEDQELKTFVTYKMIIRNQSEIPAVAVNELVDYYDSTYKVVNEDVHLNIQNKDATEATDKVVAAKSHYETSGGQTGSITWKDTGKYQTDTDKAGTKLNVMYTTDLQDIVLQSGEDLYVYVTFEVQKDANRALRLGEKSNYVEINSFSTFANNSGKNSPLGQVDRDSAPGNLNPYDTTTKEDDADSAPTIHIKMEGEQRTMNGVVWEDERTQQLATSQVVGDGIRQDKENKINGVTVQLIELVSGADGKQYEYIWQEMATGESGYQYVNSDGKVLSGQCGRVVNGSTKTDKGEYSFKDYIPGNYIVRFKYGDTEKTLLPKLNGKSYNGQDYKSTAYQNGENINAEWYDLSNEDLQNAKVSDAKDNEARRLQVINYSKVMKNNIAEVLYAVENEKQSLYKTLRENTWMYADTAKIKVQVEYNQAEANGSDQTDYRIRDIDFGIENRPKNDMELDKQILGIKVTLANGNTIIDTQNGINKNVNWVPNTKTTQGKIHIYMDEEIMQGANVQINYRITVKNVGEVDTTGANDNSVGETYYTGKSNGNDRVVTTTVDKVIDYVDNSLVFKADLNPDWKLIENTDLKSIDQMKQDGYLNSNLNVMYQNAKNEPQTVSQIIMTESLAKTPLQPGQSASVDLVLTKTISTSDEQTSLTYNNVAETLQFTNLVGRKDDIPGNKKPYEFTPSENDSDYTEEVIITPPTGGNKSMTYVAITIGILAIAGVGIIVIRKFMKK